MNMDELVNLNRRSMMQQALLLIGATAVPVDMALAAAAPRKRFLAPAQFQLLTALADTIVPVTDTPGALAAGVPAKLDGMLSNWASAATRIKVSDALGRLNGAALASKKKGFAAMTPAERKAVLTDHDKASLKAVPPPPGAPKLNFFTPATYVVDPGYLTLKGLIINLYYGSEIGSTKELIYEHNPGKYQPSIKATEATRPWASAGPF